MSNIRDVTGQTFNFLTAVESTTKIGSSKSRIWVWRCECGKILECTLNSVQSGKRKSCGCKKGEIKDTQPLLRPQLIRDNTNISLLGISKLKSNNTSGCTGVHFRKDAEYWVATIKFQKNTYHLGCYENFEDAVKARKRAEDIYHYAYLESIGIHKNGNE